MSRHGVWVGFVKHPEIRVTFIGLTCLEVFSFYITICTGRRRSVSDYTFFVTRSSVLRGTRCLIEVLLGIVR